MDNSIAKPTALIQQLPTIAPLHDPTVARPDTDAATFTSTSRPHYRLGMFCHDEQVYFLTLPDDPNELALLPIRLVGDPFADRVHVVRGLDFWIGDRSLENHPPNPTINVVLDDLLDDIASGNYPATDNDRAFARRLLAADRPRISGPCLLLGRDEVTGTSTGLPETFLNWLHRTTVQAVTDLVQTTSTADGDDASK
ncbi:hypothetical protein [Saccharothrix lopnurensis]|uniref:Uncharacterized protein n=1 Tax=Saccharothrix lopnurensis TaxID=1670621 RepID=A0ABW1PFH3_9PSEU